MSTDISLPNKAEFISFLVSPWQIDDMSSSKEKGLFQLLVSEDSVQSCLVLCARPQHDGGGSLW